MKTASFINYMTLNKKLKARLIKNSSTSKIWIIKLPIDSRMEKFRIQISFCSYRPGVWHWHERIYTKLGCVDHYHEADVPNEIKAFVGYALAFLYDYPSLDDLASVNQL